MRIFACHCFGQHKIKIIDKLIEVVVEKKIIENCRAKA